MPSLAGWALPTSLFHDQGARPADLLGSHDKWARRRDRATPWAYSERRLAVIALAWTAAALVGIANAALPADQVQPEARNTAKEEAADVAERKPHVPPNPTTEFKIVEGQVTTPGGGGDGGVTVTVRWKNQAEDGRGQPIATTRTDALGDFSVFSSKPIHGAVLVTLSKPGRVSVVRELLVGDDFVLPFLAEVLEGNLTLDGRVTDASNRNGIVGAAVYLDSYYLHREAVSDDTGRFSIQRVSPGDGTLVVTARGFGREVRRIALSEQSKEIVIGLRPERIIHLELVDERGKPIPDAAVEIYDAPRDDSRSVVSDARGRATIRGVHADVNMLTLYLAHSNYVSSQGFDREITLPDTGLESTHKLVMSASGGISGRVTEAGSGDPVYGARLRVGPNAEVPGPRAWSDHEGDYEVHGVPVGPAVVTIHMSGYGPELETVHIESGKTVMLDVELRPGGVLHGVVKAEGGQPVSEILVSTGLWRGKRTLDLHAVTDKNGLFVMENVPSDAFEIAVKKGRSGPTVRQVRAVVGETVEIVVPNAPQPVVVGGPAPHVKLTSLDGEVYDPTRLAGRTVLYDFWATWCAPCIAEMPDLRAVFEQFGARKDFVLIGVSLDGDEQAFRRFLAKEKIGWVQIYGDNGGAFEAADRFGVEGLPAIFLVGPRGTVIAKDFHGPEIRKVVAAAMSSGRSEKQ